MEEYLHEKEKIVLDYIGKIWRLTFSQQCPVNELALCQLTDLDKHRLDFLLRGLVIRGYLLPSPYAHEYMCSKPLLITEKAMNYFSKEKQ